MSFVVLHMPVDPDEPYNATVQPALEVVFGNTWRIAVGSMLAFWAGDFANSFVLAKMKVLTRGRWLWTRTIGSTAVGQAVDSVLFYPFAFYGIWSTDSLVQATLFNLLFKVSVEVLFTPLTYVIVGRLKKLENEDYYDRDTDFTPFALSVARPAK